MQPVSNENELSYRFGEFEVDPLRRLLSKGGKAVALKPKVFETLLVLVRNGGRLLNKDELMQEVWPDTIVEEVNLAHNISVLRKALGQKSGDNRFIITIPGRGYRFVADVTRVGPDQSGEAPLLVNHAETPRAPKEHPRHTVALRPHKLLLAAIVLLVSALVFGGWVLMHSARPVQSEVFTHIKSVAVLPFKPLVVESRNESLEMGMADTLITRLSNIREITVRPISAVRKYAGLEQDAVAAGREQRVDGVIDGQIQKSDEKVRVTVRLLKVEDGSQLWTSQFDQKMTDIFAIQDSISEQVAGLLAVKLSGQERERLTKHYTESAEAHQLYLLGRYHLQRLTDDGFRKSLEYFQEAIKKDANFALAHAGVADSYNALSGFNVLPPRDVCPRARSAALRALSLDPLLAPAHTALAMVNLSFDWDWTAAEKEFRQAIEINPGDSDAHYYFAYYLSFVGQFDKAIAEIRKAQELDPVSTVKLTGTAQVLLMARRYDEGLKECRSALEMDPNLGFAHWLVGLAYMYMGSYEPAIEAFKRSIPLSGDSPDEPASLARAYAWAGRKAEARKILDQLKEQAGHRYVSPGTMADIYWSLGERDKAFALFNQAYDERDNMIVLLKVEPMFDPLRSDPRFQRLVRRVGFPE